MTILPPGDELLDELLKEGIGSVIQNDQRTSPSAKQPKTQNSDKPTFLSIETLSANASPSTTDCSNQENQQASHCLATTAGNPLIMNQEISI